MFKENETKILFVYTCPQKHYPKKAIYPDRKEYIFPAWRCSKCGGFQSKSVTKETKKRLLITDTCLHCGHIHKLDLDLTPEKILPIEEEDRKKYCLDFVGRSTFIEDLLKIEEFFNSMSLHEKEKILKEENGVDKIEIVKVPQLEERLVKLAEQLGFQKFKFNTPDVTRWFTVEFSLQDPSDRDGRESEKVIAKAIRKAIFPTNWRLTNEGVSYRLGFLTGKLRAYEGDEELMKIGKEIMKKGEAKSQK
jgi:hypothetical protein